MACAVAAYGLSPARLVAQTAPVPLDRTLPSFSSASGPPPSTGGFFPLSAVHRGLKATAWTVFQGDKPEPIPVEILGVLRDARGPGQDMILAQLHGAEAEFTGVVAGMSGSPVYVGTKLLGSLSYRIGTFSKEPIAGITPIEQMLPLRNLPVQPEPPAITPDASQALISSSGAAVDAAAAGASSGQGSELQAENFQAQNFHAMDTPLVMSGFAPAAIELWQQRMAGTSLAEVAAGGIGGNSDSDARISQAAIRALEPGSAISAELVRGDLEMAATCTITYIDPKQLLACGHPIFQAGPVSLPMTAANVVTTLASPLDAFKIINTGAAVGAFTEDRESGIRGILGAQARMIPMHIAVDGPEGPRKVNVEVLDLPSLTPQAVLVVLYDALLKSNAATDQTSYHVTGNIDLAGYSPAPVDLWATPGGILPASLDAAVQTTQIFDRLYTNDARRGSIEGINLRVEAIPRRLQVALISSRIVSSDLVHAGDAITVEATLRPWQQPERNVRIPILLPARLEPGNLRLLVSDAATLDRTLNQPRVSTRPAGIDAILAEDRRVHPADRIYVSLLAPETQAAMDGHTLTGLPLSVANALEPIRGTQNVMLNGESAELAGQAPAGGVLSGFQVLTVHIDPGGGLH